MSTKVPQMTGHLRLVKVLVQPMCVWDDGESLSEVTTPPVSVPASEWENYTLAAHLDDINQQLGMDVCTEDHSGVGHGH